VICKWTHPGGIESSNSKGGRCERSVLESIEQDGARRVDMKVSRKAAGGRRTAVAVARITWWRWYYQVEGASLHR
jgi:hypothetical protein